MDIRQKCGQHTFNILQDQCPPEDSAGRMSRIFCENGNVAQYGSHEASVVTEHVECGQCG